MALVVEGRVQGQGLGIDAPMTHTSGEACRFNSTLKIGARTYQGTAERAVRILLAPFLDAAAQE